MTDSPAPVKKQDLFGRLPAAWPEDVLPEIRKALAATPRKIVVVDDDPTGCQTVRDTAVLTAWPEAALRAELAGNAPGFFILANSRARPEAEACRINREIGETLARAAGGKLPAVVSRGDSALRGHFPAEVTALAGGLGMRCDGIVLVPFFEEGGRFTVDDVHYAAEGDRLVPVGQAEFSRDAAFGFRASNLRAWVEEKTRGAVKAADVAGISIPDIRTGGPGRVAEILSGLRDGRMCVVNAACRRDVEVFTAGLLRAEAGGRCLLVRAAAAFAAARLGKAPAPLVAARDLELPAGGALVVVGSHVPRSTRQIGVLIRDRDIDEVMVQVRDLLGGSAEQVIGRAAARAEAALRRGRDAIVYTSRTVAPGRGAAETLVIGRRVSESLVKIVRGISTRPRVVVLKGGTTASDIATEALGVKRAVVAGSVIPGVPVWRLGAESRFPGLAFVVFPGNVGNDDALRDVLGLYGNRQPGSLANIRRG